MTVTGVSTAAPQMVGAPGSQAAVSARALGIGYRGDIVVGDLDLDVVEGTSLALVGTNGSGKSTLIRTFIGLLPVLSGDLRVLGRAPGKSPQRVAYLAQFHASGTVLPIRAVDVVRMARYPNLGLLGRTTAADRELVRWALEAMDATDIADMPMRSLSGGQRQRVYLAQVLARRADLIILDEPTAGLDAGGRERYLEAFAAELHRGAALVTSTHDIAEAVEYDQVLLLARRVVALGPGPSVLTPDRLMETFGIVVRDPHEEHAGRFTVAERAHGGPQTIETRPPRP